MEFKDILTRYMNMFEAYCRNHADDYVILKEIDGDPVVYGENKPYNINELEGPYLIYDKETGICYMKPYKGRSVLEK